MQKILLLRVQDHSNDYLSVFQKMDLTRLIESIKNIKSAFCPNHLALIEDNKLKLDKIALAIQNHEQQLILSSQKLSPEH